MGSLRFGVVKTTAVIAIAAAMVMVGPAVLARPPVTTPVPFQETFPDTTGVCRFPITVEFDTRQVLREWVNRSGKVVRATTSGPGSVTITNDRSGESVTADASGPTVTKNGVSRGDGNWVLIGFEEDADVLPFPPGAWLYSGRIADLDASDYSKVFRGTIIDLCAAVS
jgi:hypothetical protein